MRRRSVETLRGLIVAFAVAVALIGVTPVVATAATPPIVREARSSADDYGIVEIVASAEAGINGLTAHILSYATGEELATVTSFSLTSGTIQDGIFTADTRVHLDRFGNYKIEVDAVDALGQRSHAPFAGFLYYFIRPIFSALSFDRTTITYSRRTVKVKGTVSGVWPTDGLLRPASRIPVRVTTTYEPFVEVQTNQDGRFTGAVTLAQEDDIYVVFIGTADYGPGSSQLQHISVQPSPTRFTIKVTPGQVKLGESVTVSGQLTWKSPDGWQPLTNRRFGLEECYAPFQCPEMIDVPPTDAGGRFTVTAAPFATGFYQVSFSGSDENGQTDPFLSDVRSTAPIAVLQPARFSEFSAARDESGLVVASGHLAFDNGSPGVVPVQIQYRAPGASSSWVTVANIDDARFDGLGYGFSATVNQPAGGKWRAYFPGLAREFQTATSAKVQVAPATP